MRLVCNPPNHIYKNTMRLSRHTLLALFLGLLCVAGALRAQTSNTIQFDLQALAELSEAERNDLVVGLLNAYIAANNFERDAAAREKTAAAAATSEESPTPTVNAQPANAQTAAIKPLPPLRISDYEYYRGRIELSFSGANGNIFLQNDPTTDAEHPKTFLETRGAEFDPELLEITPKLSVDISRDYGNIYDIRGDFQPGEIYEITLKAGFPWKDAPQHLLDDYVISVLIPDLPAEASVVSDGVFFPLHAPVWELPIHSVNFTGKFKVSAYEPYPESLLNYLLSIDQSYYYSDPARWARKLAMTSFELPDRPNQSVFTPLDLSKVGIPRNRPGLYTLIHERHGGYYDSNKFRIVVTDLALFLTGANGDYLCQVRSLEHPENPVPGVQVELFSRKFQKLAKGVTDEQGELRFRVLPLQDPDDAPVLLLARNPQNHDLAYLDFNRGHLDRTGKLTSLKEPKAPQALLFAERGIALPGDEVAFTALVRNPEENRPAANTPLKLLISDPAGNRVLEKDLATDDFGMLQCKLKLSDESLLGTYDASLLLPSDDDNFTIANTTLLVANFTPDQFAARIDLPARLASDAKKLKFALQADYYFGAPVQKAKADLYISYDFLDIVPPNSARDFTFGLHDKRKPLPNHVKKGETDEHGHLEIVDALPTFDGKEPTPALPIAITVQASVKPAGARAVTATASSRLDLFERYLGSRVSQEEPDRVRVQFVALTHQNQVTAPPKTLQAKLATGNWEYLLKEQGGTYRRIWQYVEKELNTVTLQLDDENCAWIDLPGGGRYEITFLDENGCLLNQLSLWHYAGESTEHSPNPNVLDFKFDNSKYLPGQTAKITFESGFDGTCLIVSGSHHTPLLSATQPLHAGENTIEVKLPENLTQCNWFVGVTAVGPTVEDADGKLHDAPCLTGIARLAVDQSARKLLATIEAPEQTHLGETVEIALTLTDAQGQPVAGEAALWGVDEGILALTGFQTPDAYAAFFDNAKCPFELNNLYPDLYPMLRVVNGQIGGGATGAFVKGAKDFQSKLQDPNEPPHVVQLGLLKTDENGRATATVTLPKFAGTLRLMAVATNSTTRLGHAQRQVVMHDEVTLTFVAPRVAAPGDTIVLRASVFNQELPETQFNWSFGRQQEGFRSQTGSLALDKGASGDLAVRLVVPPDTAEGALPVSLVVETPDGKRFEKRAVITVRSHIPPQPICDLTVLQPGEELAVELTGQATDRLLVGSPVARLQRHWQWLNDYPYGCLEQITAAAFPQLAVADLVAAKRLPESLRAGARQRVQDTLDRYSAYHTYGGWYAMWPHGYETGRWTEGSLFAFLFQAEATRAGYQAMDRAARNRRIEMLRTYTNDRSNSEENRALALYVLAVHAPTYVRNYAKFLLNQHERHQPFTIFLTAMALLRGGYANEGMDLWNTIADTEFTRFPPDVNDCPALDTPVRRTGLALWLLADLLPDDPRLPKLALALDNMAADDSCFTTQEHAWYALGMSKYLLTLPPLQGDSRLAATITAADGTARELDVAGDLPAEVTADGSYTLRNTGTEPLNVVHNYRASRSDNAKNVDTGLHIRREYLDLEGKPVTTCKVGAILTVKIYLSGAAADNLVVSDLLPAGLEIEDERLLTRFTTPKQKDSLVVTEELTANLLEKRFDRLLWFGDFYGSTKEHVITYQVRAVIPGIFQVPPAQVEAMYRPQLKGITYPETPTLTIEE